jgi:hypothetical protein
MQRRSKSTASVKHLETAVRTNSRRSTAPADPFSVKTFILCLGAQKSGTSWLHGYLSSLPHVDFGFAKEYHQFDPDPVRVRMRRRARALYDFALGFRLGGGDERARKRAWFALDRRRYYDYFEALLRQPDVRVTGDFTPAYSAVEAPVLRGIRDNFTKRGIGVRPVFLMRDPVERCWSALRMERRNVHARPGRPGSVTPHQMALSEEDHLLQMYRSERFEVRTRYDRTIEEIEKVVAPEDASYAFFEELFTEQAARRLCGELGLTYRRPEFLRQVNVSEKHDEISEATKAEIARYYAPVYRFVATRFGEDLIGRIWPNYRFAG